MHIVAGVLIGGQSRRMGRCKALLPIGGQTFVEKIVQVLQPVASEVVMLGSLPEKLPALPNIALLPDPPGADGPLAGLAALLKRAGSRWGLLVACDLPLISSPLIQRLVSSRDDQLDAVVFSVHEDGQELYPCCGIFHPRILQNVRQELLEGKSLQKLLKIVRCQALLTNLGERICLTNINTPVEYKRISTLDKTSPQTA